MTFVCLFRLLAGASCATVHETPIGSKGIGILTSIDITMRVARSMLPLRCIERRRKIS